MQTQIKTFLLLPALCGLVFLAACRPTSTEATAAASTYTDSQVRAAHGVVSRLIGSKAAGKFRLSRAPKRNGKDFFEITASGNGVCKCYRF